MEFLYTKIHGPVNPKIPNQPFKLLKIPLKLTGVWPLKTRNNYRLLNFIYNLYSIVLRIIFVYVFILCEMIYFKDVSHVLEVADTLFILMTQICLLYKLEKIYSNRYRLKTCVDMLNSQLFIPKSEEEEIVVKKTMLMQFFVFVMYSIPVFLTMVGMIFSPWTTETRILVVPSWYPVDLSGLGIFMIFHVYQMCAVAISATCNVAFDMFCVGLLLQMKIQFDRLGVMLKNFGHENNNENEGNSENYMELKQFIKIHKRILSFLDEIEDVYSSLVFCQFAFSSLIICMTLLLMADQGSLTDALMHGSYLMGMVAQIYVYCYSGNEVYHAANDLTVNIYFSDFTKFDHETKKAIIFFMQRAQKVVMFSAGKNFFKINLNLEIFMGVLKSSYSYFTLLRTIENK